MAITADIPVSGLSATGAYCRVTDIVIKKVDNADSPDNGTFYMTYGVACYVDAAARNAENPQTLLSREVDRFKVKGLATPPSDPYAAAYADLKAQAAVSNAVDA